MPEQVRIDFKAFKRQHSGKDIGQYWIDSCQRKGLYDDLANAAVLFSPSIVAIEWTGGSSHQSGIETAKTADATRNEGVDSPPRSKGARRRSRKKQQVSTISDKNEESIVNDAVAGSHSNCGRELQTGPFVGAVGNLPRKDVLNGYSDHSICGSRRSIEDDGKLPAVGNFSAPDVSAQTAAFEATPISVPNGCSDLDPIMRLSPFSPSLLDVLGGGQAQPLTQGPDDIPSHLPRPPLHDGSSSTAASGPAALASVPYPPPQS